MTYWMVSSPVPAEVVPPVAESLEKQGWSVRSIVMVGSIVISKIANQQSPAMMIYASKVSDDRPEAPKVSI